MAIRRDGLKRAAIAACVAVVWAVSGSAPFDAVARAQGSADWWSVDPGETVRSYREARYHETIGQTDWHTCGAAAVATWLTFYLDRPASEMDVLSVAVHKSEERGLPIEGGLTLLALKETLEEFQVRAQGYRIPPARLTEYFAAGGLPLLLHVTRPKLHYMLAVGVQDGYVVLSDPSFGRRLSTMEALIGEKGFEGVVLAAVLDESQADTAALAQRRSLEAASRRLAGLERLQVGVLP